MLEILPETDNTTLVVKASQELSNRDYEDIFIPQLNQRLKNIGNIRVVIVFDDDFKGWEAGAAWDDLVFGIQHRLDFQKVAVVGKQIWLKWATKIGAYFMSGQVKTFSTAAYEDAVDWVKQ